MAEPNGHHKNGSSLWDAVYPAEQYVLVVRSILDASLHRNRHLQAFAAALSADEVYLESSGGLASPQIGSTATPPSARIRKISALSDWAPINLKVKK